MSVMTSAIPTDGPPSLPPRLRGDPVRRLLDALEAMAYDGTRATLVAATPWASGMFEGVRYAVMLLIPGPLALTCADRMRVALPEAEFAISGHLVADVTVDDAYATDDAAVLCLSVLVLREG